MELQPTRVEIDHRTIKLLVGVIAIALPVLVSWIAAPDRLTSVSESYWIPHWPRTIFIGFLFAIAAFLSAYNGRSTSEMVASKVAAIAGVLIPMLPCGCEGNAQIIPGVHYTAAAAMLLPRLVSGTRPRLSAMTKTRAEPGAMPGKATVSEPS